ncbi:MAG: MlaD family protein [Cyanobacteriota bacterium]
MKLQHEIKVGLFIIASIALLVYVILWLHKFDMSSYLQISARFKDVGTLSIGSSVLYRGVKAGTIYDIVISKDQEYALVKINITNKEIKIYEGSVASVVDKGFTGTKALAITPPDNITDKKVLTKGAIIEGRRSFTLDEFQRTLTKLSDEFTLEEIIREMHLLLKNTNDLTGKLDTLADNTETVLNQESGQKLNKFLEDTTKLSRSLEVTSKHLNNIIGDKKVSTNIKQSIANTNQAMQNLNKVVDKSEIIVDKTGTLVDKSSNTVDNLNNTVTNLDNTINNPDLHGSLRENMQKMSEILTDVQDITGDKEIKSDLKEIIKTSNESIQRLNCVGKGLSSTLSKRFLLPRMMLGTPGKSLNSCSQLDNIDVSDKNKENTPDNNE